MDAALSALGNRVFLLNNAHEREPVVFETRWTLSYLAGPLTRAQIRSLAKPPAAAASVSLPAAPAAAAPNGPRPILPAEIPQYFLPSNTANPLYRPFVAGAAAVHFLDARHRIDDARELMYLAPVTDDPVPLDWADAQESAVSANGLSAEPQPGASFVELPAAAAKARNYAAWSKSFAAWLFQTQSIEIHRSPLSRLSSSPGESEGQFRARLQHAAREERDRAVEKIRARYASRLATLEERLRRAEQAVERERQQAGEQTMRAAVSVAGGVLGALFGRKSILGSAGAVAGSAGRVQRERGDVTRAAETVEAVREQLESLRARVEAEIAELQARTDPASEELETVAVRLKKTNIAVRFVALVWAAQAPQPAAGPQSR
jgi:hypothetical protein